MVRNFAHLSTFSSGPSPTGKVLTLMKETAKLTDRRVDKFMAVASVQHSLSLGESIRKQKEAMPLTQSAWPVPYNSEKIPWAQIHIHYGGSIQIDIMSLKGNLIISIHFSTHKFWPSNHTSGKSSNKYMHAFLQKYIGRKKIFLICRQSYSLIFVAINWKQSKYLSIGDWLNQLWFLHTWNFMQPY